MQRYVAPAAPALSGNAPREAYALRKFCPGSLCGQRVVHAIASGTKYSASLRH